MTEAKLNYMIGETDAVLKTMCMDSSDDEQARTLAAIGKHIVDQDVVITTAQIPGRAAPRLITAEMVQRMRPGSVIVDVAADTGGNCELTQPGETVTVMIPAVVPTAEFDPAKPDDYLKSFAIAKTA